MPNYHLNELSAAEFEDLVVHICIDLLGEGTSKFAEGRDGGRDAKFIGTANKFPSQSSPASGHFIIQAKRASSPTASCSDSEFKTKILDKEIPKIKNLKQNGELDNYILFTNRKKTGGKDFELVNYLREKIGIENIWLRGKEDIERYLADNPKLVKQLKLDQLRLPLVIHPEELVKLIEIFHNYLNSEPVNFDSLHDFQYTKIENKNIINQLSNEYFNYIQENSESYFTEIKNFLENPRNTKFKIYYHNIADELKGKFIHHREKFITFEEIFTYLYDKVLEEYPTVENRRLINVFLHYMYCNCDFGKKE